MSRLAALERRPGAALAALVGLSTAIRFLAALTVKGPVYFRDEYLYSAIARSFADGDAGRVRGVHLPLNATISYLPPLLTSPVWLVRSVPVAYRLSELVAAAVFSLAAVPGYALARSVDVSRRGSLIVALLVLVVPAGMFTGTLMTEPYAYLAFLGAMTTVARGLSSPSIRSLALIAAWSIVLCVTAGTQFLLFGPCCMLAIVLLSPTRLTLLLRTAVGASLVALGLLAFRVSGHWAFVSNVWWLIRQQDLGVGGLLSWGGATLLMLAVGTGWVAVPGAAVGLVGLYRKSRRGRAFVVLTVLLTVGLLFEAAVFGANGGQLYERFAFYVTPLYSIAFVWWWEDREHGSRAPYAAVAYAAAAGALLLPLTSTLSGSASHSPVLAALRTLSPVASGGGKVVWVPALAAIAVVTAFVGPARRRYLPVAALGVTVLVAVGATIALHDRAAASPLPRVSVPDGSSLLVSPVDHFPSIGRILFWNRAIDRVLVFGDAPSPDGYPSTPVRLSANGSLEALNGSRVSGAVAVGPDAAVFPESRTRLGRDGMVAFNAPLRAVVLGYHRNGGYLLSYAATGVARAQALVIRPVSASRAVLAAVCDGDQQKHPPGHVIRITAGMCTLRIVRGGLTARVSLEVRVSRTPDPVR